jgi:hypothetical protein
MDLSRLIHPQDVPLPQATEMELDDAGMESGMVSPVEHGVKDPF